MIIAAALALAMPASASAARLYVAVGDSVGAGVGATPGHSFFDLYCAYLKSSAGGARVDQCFNQSVPGLTTQQVVDGGPLQSAVGDIRTSTDTPVVTVVLGGNDLLGSPGCEPITGVACPFIRNLRAILDRLEAALAAFAGPHVIQVLEYYNPNHNNPFGNPSADQVTAGLLLGSDLSFSDCASTDLGAIGLDDAINCIVKEKRATPVDVYMPFETGCGGNDCFSDSLHPDDKGYGLIFDALRDTPASPVPAMPPPDGSWPYTGPPQNSAPPGVTGFAVPNTTLTCDPGIWVGDFPISYSVQWLRDSFPIAGENAPTYYVQGGDSFHSIACVVTASNAAGSATQLSGAVTVKPVLSQGAVRTLAATSVTASSASLHGVIATGGARAQWVFSWGRTNVYGFNTTIGTTPARQGDVTVATTVTNLTPGTTYHYRLGAEAPSGGRHVLPIYGADVTFTTRTLGAVKINTFAGLKHRTVTIGLRCASTQPCTGSLKGTVKSRGKLVSCLRKPFSIKPGRTTTVAATISRACVVLLAKASQRRLRVTVVATVTTGQPAARKTITLGAR